VQSDLPFLRVAGPTLAERPFDESDLLQRTYTYTVTLDSSSPADSFTGRIWAVDPWTGKAGDGVLVSHRVRPEISVIPMSLTLDADPSTGSSSGQIVITTKREMPSLVVEAASDDQSFRVSEATAGAAGKCRKFVISAKSGAVRGIRTTSLFVRRNPGDKDPIVVPVIMRGPAK
jgi:hypothetical protein